MIWRSLVLMAILSFAAGIQIFVETAVMGYGGRAVFTQNDWSLDTSCRSSMPSGWAISAHRRHCPPMLVTLSGV